ncbi:hypothetical protein ACFXG9_38785 [Streptomyces mirabilis]|uniref:hypothetical protein n=1 Tax=Streptomyces mirabilis TaxID=68239 RepID=UPI0036CF17FE
MIQDGYRDLRVPDDSGRSARDGPAELPGHPVRICRFPPVRHLNPSASPTATVTPTSTAAAPLSSMSPLASPSTSSPAAGTGLAETGGGSDTGLIAGSAAAVIAAGAGVS